MCVLCCAQLRRLNGIGRWWSALHRQLLQPLKWLIEMESLYSAMQVIRVSRQPIRQSDRSELNAALQLCSDKHTNKLTAPYLRYS